MPAPRPIRVTVTSKREDGGFVATACRSADVSRDGKRSRRRICYESAPRNTASEASAEAMRNLTERAPYRLKTRRVQRR